MISPGLRQKFETLRQNIVASGTTNTLATNKAEVKLIKDQRSKAKVRSFAVIQDEPESIGGTGQGLTPNGLFHRISRLLRERHFRQKCKPRGTILRFAGDNRDWILGQKRIIRDRQHRPILQEHHR